MKGSSLPQQSGCLFPAQQVVCRTVISTGAPTPKAIPWREGEISSHRVKPLPVKRDRHRGFIQERVFTMVHMIEFVYALLIGLCVILAIESVRCNRTAEEDPDA
jgi:hypothetical protein